MGSRRNFIKRSGLISLGLFSNPLIPALPGNLQDDPGAIKITGVDAIYFNNAHWTWIRVHTSAGITGLGETYPFTRSQVGAVKDLVSVIIGKDPRDIEGIWKSLYTRAAFNVTGGAEMRIISAIDIALWDILGKYYKAPLYRLLGGKARENIHVYNTTNGIGDWTNEKDIERITEFFLGNGIKAMKIWPFDPVARKNTGSYISPSEIESNLDWIKRIRNTAGSEMEIGVEFHAYWNLPAAQRIATALEPYQIMWIEDIMFPENVEAYAKLASETSIPVCVSERLATSYPYARLFTEKACDIAMFDVTWCGGLTAAKKIADLADTFMIPSAPHTYGGPVLWYASAHLAIALTNLWIMESGYYFYHDVYPGFIEEVLVPVNGVVVPPDEPGLGMKIKEGLLDQKDTVVEKIA
ncbi:MAG: mandelate racemase/muconate lactonizing enzyme family protein [Cyclobacteriaceae bacterium]|nr:mandelate racemase/muconate lactonizing enzyme family protein [Cyclobacteriaceae bacterium]